MWAKMNQAFPRSEFSDFSIVGLWRSWERASMAWKRSSVRSRPGPPISLNNLDRARTPQPRPRLRISLTNEVGNSRVGGSERLFLRQEYDAEVLRAGLLTEAGAVDDHHMLLADEFLDEYFVALGDVAFWKTYARKSVERATRRDATHARC